MKTSIILTLLHYVCIIYSLLQFVHASLYFTFQDDPPKLCILSETCFETCTSLSEHISRFTINNLKTMVYFQLLWSHTLPIFFSFHYSHLVLDIQRNILFGKLLPIWKMIGWGVIGERSCTRWLNGRNSRSTLNIIWNDYVTAIAR